MSAPFRCCSYSGCPRAPTELEGQVQRKERIKPSRLLIEVPERYIPGAQGNELETMEAAEEFMR